MAVKLTAPVSDLLMQLHHLLESLTDDQYSKKIRVLSNASLGQHTRHIIEFFLELNTGYKNGLVNYDGRKRDFEIETNRICAIEKLLYIISELDKEDKPLLLLADYSNDNNAPHELTTNYLRELAYNLEHTIHHMALLKIGVHFATGVVLPQNFGVAISTIKYRNTCAR